LNDDHLWCDVPHWELQLALDIGQISLICKPPALITGSYCHIWEILSYSWCSSFEPIHIHYWRGNEKSAFKTHFYSVPCLPPPPTRYWLECRTNS
jgi:hypothetical protein